jgi:signal transduction histidine kinase
MALDEIQNVLKEFDEMKRTLEETEFQLQKRSAELGGANKELQGKLTDLEDTKKAVLNLLEDLDIEKKKVEDEVRGKTKELREEKARLLASINSLSFGFIIADTNDTVIVKNAAISSILELTQEPTSVRDIVDSFRGVSAGLDVLVHSCRECIDLKKVVELKEISHGKKYLRVFCTPIITKDEMSQDMQDMQEKVIGYAMLVEDVTEARIMERSRDEFFAVASHELRTPLTAIRGNADMMLEMYTDKIVDKDMKEMLQDIDTSSVRLINIVNDFLEVSRLEQGKIEIKKENFNVSDVVEKVVRDLKIVDAQKGLSLVYTTPSSPLPTVFADKQRTEQILINLVGNAAKFTKEGGITITASVVDGFVGIRVIDTGSGISEHNQALLFRKFQQAGEQMLARDVTQSTGLGLYISKLIISSMGGTIGIEKSELGKGSTFVFTLPISK